MAGTTIYNSSFCNDKNAGTGVMICDLGAFGTPRGGGLLNDGSLIDIATVAESTFDTLIKSRKLHNFPKMFDFKQTNDKNGTAKSSIGVEVETMPGLIKMELEWINNPCLHKALYNMKGFGKYSPIWYTDLGAIFYRNAAGTHLKGADAGMFSVESLEFQNGANPMKTMATIQLTNPQEFNTKFVFKTWEDLGYNLSEKAGVVDTVVTVVGTPTASSTSLVVSVKSACGGALISSLDVMTNWAVGGTQAVPRTVTAVAYSAVTGLYTLTLSGAIGSAATVAPFLTDGTYKVATDVTGSFFAGAATVLAIT